MGENKVDKMAKDIRSHLRPYLVAYVLLIAFATFADQVIAFLSSFAGNPSKSTELTDEFLKILETVVPAIVAAIVAIAGDFRIHDLLDEHFLGLRAEIGRIIRVEFEASMRRLSRPDLIERIRTADQASIMDLFYHFANKQKVKRALAFSYWTRYFRILAVEFFGVLTVITLVVVFASINTQHYEIVTFLTVFLALVLSMLALRTRSSLLPKIKQLPVGQIRDVVADTPDELIDQVKARVARE